MCLSRFLSTSFNAKLSIFKRHVISKLDVIRPWPTPSTNTSAGIGLVAHNSNHNLPTQIGNASKVGTQATWASALRPTLLPISARVARSGFESLRRAEQVCTKDSILSNKELVLKQ
jgi:hypothetical protein